MAQYFTVPIQMVQRVTTWVITVIQLTRTLQFINSCSKLNVLCLKFCHLQNIQFISYVFNCLIHWAKNTIFF